MSERMMKIGRSCPCGAPMSEAGSGAAPGEGEGNCDCQGWKPKPPGTLGRVDTCACGHKLSFHGGPWTGEEFERRLRAAIRRDELLQDKGKLLDFEYDDEDIASLRKYIEESEGPTKHSQAEDGEDENMDREYKRIKIEKDDSQDSTQPSTSDTPPAEQDGDQADDADQSSEQNVPIKKEKPAVIEERQGLIEFRVFTNDGSRESMILLTGMKNLFQKQLPKMPREYIARLVYDRNHYSMAIVKAPLIVLGGITYRPFNHRKFAEIVFCAITSTEQVKGYGSHLMNHLKDYISENTDVQHFLTYADNYAIGYFKKQGFTKDITLDRSIWMGYIKDYEGGTIMQCTMVPRESGWDPEMDNTPRVPVHGPFYNAMKHIVAELIKDASSWPFLQPVDTEAVTDYYSYIKDPMDLSTLETNVDRDVYVALEDFAKDCKKIFDNCRLYNGESTPYVKCANKLEKVFKDKLKEWKEA
ncbi:hypothetical protein EDD21DRAFT_394227 [Dissophora ornata]|nr:hypothetical protein EDD21DRAFT_394227 [Dissophora ornata]